MGIDKWPKSPNKGDNIIGWPLQTTRSQLFINMSEDTKYYVDVIFDDDISISEKIQTIKDWIENSSDFKLWLTNNRLKEFTQLCKDIIEDNDCNILYKAIAAKIWYKYSEDFKSRLTKQYYSEKNEILIEDKNIDTLEQDIQALLTSDAFNNLLSLDEINDYHKSIMKSNKKRLEAENKKLRWVNNTIPYNIAPTLIKYIVDIVKPYIEENLPDYFANQICFDIDPRDYVDDDNIVRIKPLKKVIENNLLGKANKFVVSAKNKQEKFKIKDKILPELFLMKRSYDKTWKWKWNDFENAFLEKFKICDDENFDIIKFLDDEELKSEFEKILEWCWWKSFEKEKIVYDKKLKELKFMVDSNWYDFITLPDNIVNKSNREQVNNLSEILVKNKRKVGDISICFNKDDLLDFLEEYDIKRDISDKFNNIVFENLWIWYKVWFLSTIWEFDNKKLYRPDDLESRVFNAIKTYLLKSKPGTSIDENALIDYIFEKVFSTQYEYSNEKPEESKKNLIKYFFWKWGVINEEDAAKWNDYIGKRNENENGLNLMDFLTIFYEETNIAFAQNFQRWNNNDIGPYWLKSDIIGSIIKLAIKNAKTQINDPYERKEIIINILKSPLCHVKKKDKNWKTFWVDTWFSFKTPMKDVSKGKRTESKDRGSFLDNISLYILWDWLSREFKIGQHERRHNWVYPDGPAYCIEIAWDLRFVLSKDNTFFTINEIAKHGKNSLWKAIKRAS